VTASGITNSKIDELFELGRKSGAIAGKISGAGGGGFIMFIVRPEDRVDVIDALNAAGATANPVKFTDKGCESWQAKSI
jgi:D-glycero-alpha-D-manno-heptose-7-phosphate kinase